MFEMEWIVVRMIALMLCVSWAAELMAEETKGPAAQTLRWKWEKGQKLPYELRQNITIEQEVNGKPIETKLDVSMQFQWEVKALDEAGNGQIEQQIKRIEFAIHAPGFEVVYDSQAANRPEDVVGKALTPVFDAMTAAPFQLLISPLGEVKEFKLPEKLKPLLENNPAVSNLGSLFTPDGLRQFFTEALVSFPAEAATVGTKWTRTTRSPTPPLGTQELAIQFTYAGADFHAGQPAEKILLHAQLSLTPTPGSNTKVDILSQDAAGLVYFSGHLLQSRFSQHASLSMTKADRKVAQKIHTLSTMKLMEENVAE